MFKIYTSYNNKKGAPCKYIYFINFFSFSNSHSHSISTSLLYVCFSVFVCVYISIRLRFANIVQTA